MEIKWNVWTILSVLFLLAGIIFFVGWGINYGVWVDLGVYALSIFLLLVGIFGFLLNNRAILE